jgi:hypothetical protein
MNAKEAAELLNVTLLENDEIQKGDMYIAYRKLYPQLLTCESVHPTGYIISTEPNVYPFDIKNCYKVIQCAAVLE